MSAKVTAESLLSGEHTFADVSPETCEVADLLTLKAEALNVWKATDQEAKTAASQKLAVAVLDLAGDDPATAIKLAEMAGNHAVEVTGHDGWYGDKELGN